MTDNLKKINKYLEINIVGQYNTTGAEIECKKFWTLKAEEAILRT